MQLLAGEGLTPVDGDHVFDSPTLQHERLASRCVCCGSDRLSVSPAILMPFVADRVFGWKPVTIDDSWGLHTIPNGNAFAICKSMHCSNCGHLFCDIRFSDSEMSALYDRYREEEYTALRDHYEPGYRIRNEALNSPIIYVPEIESFLEPFLELPLTVLDWGGDTGINTPFKGKNVGLDVYDISHREVEAGARTVSRDQVLSSKYRLVVCSMVLEHVPYPSDALLEIKHAMDAGSILYIEVPFEEIMRGGEPNPGPLKRHWHEHINFYSARSMRHLVQNCGFELLRQSVLATTVAGSDVQIFQIACRLKR